MSFFGKFSRSLSGSLNSINVYKLIKGKIYMKIPKNSLVVGSPGKIVRQVKDFEREMILERPQEYIDLASIYLNE